MIDYYQPRLMPFLSRRVTSTASSPDFTYYHSFEDGLWDFMHQKFSSRKQVTFLVPDFYCSDVLDNLKRFGHRYIYYPLDSDFQISASAFRKYLWLYRPDVIILFHACGITSRLTRDTSWLSDLPASSWIIEDHVHRLSDPRSLRFIADKHIILDSLRKVSPIPGSRMWAASGKILPTYSWLPSFYSLASSALYILFRSVQRLGHIIGNPRIIVWTHVNLLKNHDELIGNSYRPYPGWFVFRPFIRHLNYSAVVGCKTHQVRLYRHCLKQVYSGSDLFYRIRIPVSDYGLLHAFPLGFTRSADSSLETCLHRNGICSWFKFTDTPWSRDRSVLFLPLGFHITDSDIRHITHVLSDYSLSSSSSSFHGGMS